MKKSLRVELDARSYEIFIGSNLLEQAGNLLLPILKRPNVIIITDSNVAGLHLQKLVDSLNAAKIKNSHIILQAGEQTKSFAVLEKLLEDLLQTAPDRNLTLIALGGGVIGDITGFTASILLRGVDFVQIPTTLLAQVDSSVGGKTGINSRFGKNLIGTFYQPQAVIADTNLLLNLPKRELLAGYAEVVKYGIIADYPFFVWLEEHAEKALAGDLDALAHIVHESCKTKAEIVSGDEKEAGLRATLNFGHTLGHALEAETGYSDKLLHGEAVAIGSLLAMRLSVARNLCSVEDYDRVKKHFEKIGLPTEFAGMDSNRLIEHCYRDKKAKDGKLTFILSQGIGKSIIAGDVSEQELQDLLKDA